MKNITWAVSITPRDSKSITILLRELNKKEYDPLSPEKEAELGEAIKKWDLAAQDELVKHNMRFVVRAAKKFHDPKMTLEFSDLVSAGLSWLMQAASRRDTTKWFKFISYAVRYIAWSILSEIYRYSDTVQIPLNKKNDIVALMNEFWKHEYMPLNVLIDAKFQDAETKNDLMSALAAYQHTYNIDGKYSASYDSDSAPYKIEFGQWWETIPALKDLEKTRIPYYNLEHNDFLQELRAFLDAKLTPLQKDVIFHLRGVFWYEKLSLQDLADKHYYTKTTIQNIRNEWRKKLEKSGMKDILRKYFEDF